MSEQYADSAALRFSQGNCPGCGFPVGSVHSCANLKWVAPWVIIEEDEHE